MIKSISGAKGIIVSGGIASMPYVNMSSLSAGMIRYNGNNQNLEVYDGTGWITMSMNHVLMELDADTQSLLEWARAKRAEEDYLKMEAARNPTIKDLLDQRKDIDSKITMVKILTQNRNEYGESEVQASP